MAVMRKDDRLLVRFFIVVIVCLALRHVILIKNC